MVSWPEVCRQKDQGRLGVINAELFNKDQGRLGIINTKLFSLKKTLNSLTLP
jgi:hypothetical protein